MRLWLATFALLACASSAAAPQIDETHTVTLASGRALELAIRRPDVEGALPAVILFGGFEGTARILDTLQSERPLIRASFAYPWEAPESVRPGAVAGILRSFGQAVRDTFAGIDALTQLLRQHPHVDAQRLTIVGASAGAPFATIAGQRHGIPGVVVVQGFGDLGDVIAHQFDLRLVPEYGRWVRPLTWLFAHFAVWWLELPHPEDAAQGFHTSQRVLMVTATEDERIPAPATEILWSAIRASDARATRRDLPGDHLRGHGDPEIKQIMQLALRWMEDTDLIPPAQ